jgi:N-acetylmuramoyl-L-alanine amidase
VSWKPDSRLVAQFHGAANIEPRRDGLGPELLILHYTGMSSAEKAIDWLARAESRVSCHYVVDEAGRITQLVPEKLRAWHAGVSSWRGKSDINSRSIGIEIQNPGHEHGYPDFPAAQMKAVIALSLDIMGRHGMRPEHVLAHSDIAPERKVDPGEKFKWGTLARAGVGHWVKPSILRPDDAGYGTGAKNDAVEKAQRLLAAYGYDTPVTGELDQKMGKVLRAFQLHFRQDKVDGRLDHSTLRTLERLVAALKMPAAE